MIIALVCQEENTAQYEIKVSLPFITNNKSADICYMLRFVIILHSPPLGMVYFTYYSTDSTLNKL